MKTALITTTINIPSVLALYRRFDPSEAVRFFVAIDKKTPKMGALNFLDGLGNYCWVEGTSYKCDAIIGHNSIQRRNLALLEALRWGADIIVSVDDDNIPLDPNYFIKFRSLFYEWKTDRPAADKVPTVRAFTPPTGDWQQASFSGLEVGSPLGWFDVGVLLQPPATHRGYPHDIDSLHRFTHVIDAKIGVAAGICLGDPDTSAVERIAKRPNVHGVSEVLKAGLVVDPKTHTVFNSQNTAIIRELAPAWSMWCGVSRYDDILASLLVQRVMRDRDYRVHFGRPFVLQERNTHDLTKDLAGELWGMQHIVEVSELLDRIDIGAGSVVEQTRRIFTAFQKHDWMPRIASEAGLAFLEDCERIL